MFNNNMFVGAGEATEWVCNFARKIMLTRLEHFSDAHHTSGFRFGSPLKSRTAAAVAAGADELFLDEGEKAPPRTAAAAGRRMGGWADERAKTAKSVSGNLSSDSNNSFCQLYRAGQKSGP